MTQPPENQPPNTPPENTPPGDGPSDAAKAGLKGLIRETLDEWLEDNKPAPKRTEKGKSWLDNILGM